MSFSSFSQYGIEVLQITLNTRCFIFVFTFFINLKVRIQTISKTVVTVGMVGRKNYEKSQ